MAIVHDPRTLISGVLTDSSSGSANIYEFGSPVSPVGRKINSQSLGVDAEKKWGAEDANLLGHLLTDTVNLGTVPLFLSSTALQATASSLQTWVSASGARYDSASSSFSATQVKYNATSASIGVWPSTGTYPGPFAADLSGGLTSMSGIIMYAAYKASGALQTALTVQGDIITLQNSSSDYSASLYGIGTPAYTGILGPWPSGAMQELTYLSTSYWGSDFPGGVIRSQSLQVVSKLFLGTENLADIADGSGTWTGSWSGATLTNLRSAFYDLSAAFYPTSASYWNFAPGYPVLTATVAGLSATLTPLSAAFYPLSTSYYDLSASYATLSSNLDASASIWNTVSGSVSGVAHLTSANWTPDGGLFSVSGNVEATGAFISRIVPSVSSILPGFILSGGEGGFSSGTSLAWSASDGLTHIVSKDTGRAHLISDSPSFGVRSVNYDQNKSTSGSWAQGVFDFDISEDRTFAAAHVIIATQFAEIRMSEFGTIAHSASTPGPNGETGIALKANSGDIGLTATIGGINAVVAPLTSAVEFGSGGLNVDSTSGGVYIRTATSGANLLEVWMNTDLVGRWDSAGAIAVSGDFTTPGTIHASGGLDAGGTGKVTNMGFGTVSSDAAAYGQLQPVSSSLVAVSQSVSGVLNSSSLSTPTALFLKSPNGSIYRIQVDNSGILSSTLV